MASDLDRLDIQLLNVVQAHNQLTANDLSERIALSPSAALRRLNRLRQTGAIAREVAVVSDGFLAKRVSGVVSIQLTRHAPEVVAALKANLMERPQVQMMLEISGAFDMLLLVVERDMAAFVDFTEAMLAASPHVCRFETSFVKRRLKNTQALLLEPRDALAERRIAQSAQPERAEQEPA